MNESEPPVVTAPEPGQAISAWMVDQYGGRAGGSPIVGIVEGDPKRRLQMVCRGGRIAVNGSRGMLRTGHALAMLGGRVTIAGYPAQLTRGVTPEEDERDLMRIIQAAMDADKS